MRKSLPLAAVLLGVLGLLPFVACGLVALSNDDGTRAMRALIAYGAIILGFVSGSHWGFVLTADTHPTERRRLAVGVLPPLIGWGAVLLSQAAQPAPGLALLILAFIATALLEHHAGDERQGPVGYMLLRWVLTSVVVILLVLILVLRLLGWHQAM